MLFRSALKAFARSTYKGICVIDFSRNDFLYVSDSMVSIFGEDKDKILEYGCDIYSMKLPTEELKTFLEINTNGFKFLNNIPTNEITEYTISYDIHIIKGGKKQLFHHCLTPMLLTEDGKTWLALCTFSPSAGKKIGHVRVQKSGDSLFYEYDLLKHRWEEKITTQITDKEREILLLSMQGYTMNEISTRLCKSIDTIKLYKRMLFTKLDVKNITEAISHALNYRLFY